MPSPPSSRLLPRRLLAILAASILGLTALFAATGCGGGGNGNENADPAKIAPKDTLIYFSALIRPEGRQKAAVDAIARKVLGVDDPGARIKTLIEQSIRDSGSKLSYEDDVEPWLGRRAAVAVTSLYPSTDPSQIGARGSSQVATIIAAKDTDKARDALDKAAEEKRPKPAKRSYQGVDYHFAADDESAGGVVDDYLVIGTETGFKAVVDASKSEGLSDNSQFKGATEGSEEKLGFGYVDTKSVIGSLGASGQLPGGAAGSQALLGLGAVNKPVTMMLDATPDRVTLEAIANRTARGAGRNQASELLPGLSADSWLGLAIPNFGKSIKQVLDQLSGGVASGLVEAVEQQLRATTGLSLDRDILPTLGEVALFARGSSLLTVGGGVVIKPDDPAAARRVLDKLGPLIRSQGQGQIDVSDATVDGAKGLKITGEGLPGAINAVLKGDRLVVAYTDAATREALDPRKELGDAPAFQQAVQSLGGALPALFVAFAPVADIAAAVSPENAAQIRQYLGAFTTLAAGSQVKGDKVVGRFVVNLK